MNEINKNEIILNEEDNKEENIKEKEDENNNLFETDLLKYNFDFATKFNSINYLNLNNTSKQKFLCYIFLISTKLNFFNKIVSLDCLYPIFSTEKNIPLMYYLISKLVEYIKTQRIPIFMINTNLFFCYNFLSNNQNYYFAYNIISDLKKINQGVSFDKDTITEINDFIQLKINSFENYFKNLKDEKFSILDKIINNLLNKNKKQKEKKLEDDKGNGENDNINNNKENNNIINTQDNKYLYLINKIWLENANKFIYNYNFAKQSKSLSDFFEEAFSVDNTIYTFISSEKIKAPINNKIYPFPGPINNFPLIKWKDKLNDPIDKDDKYLLKNNLENKKDFIWIEKEDWNLLKETFGFTNEIKRKKDELEMEQISFIIFDYRMKNYKDDCINFMKKKVVQISKNKNINGLEDKIIRCMNFEINMLKIKYNQINKDAFEDKIIYLYKVNKNNRDIIIEMYLSFINNIITYESVFFEEIILTKEDKTKQVNELFNKYNSKKEILILEINTINSTKFLQPIKTNELSCSICSKPIKDLNDTKYMCELCSMYLFCSKECAKISNENDNNIKILEHFKLHQYLSDLNNRPFNYDEFTKLNLYKEINTEENKDKNKGDVGLYNLGNTCYMNCSLQCLSHTYDLTKYFLNNYFRNEINLESKFGSNGILLKSYFDLINLMWLSEDKIINPKFFRNAFIISTNKFNNNHQQDAMEFISILLNYFHEDLNRIHEKPYIEMNSQQENELDIQASERFNNYYLQRENSIIIDLFNGQFQNIIKCTECFIENKTYEPFNNITLPIPEEHNFYIIKFFTQEKCKYITININSETTFGDLVKKATKFLSKKILDSIEEVKKIYTQSQKYIESLLEKNIEIVKLDKHKIINVIYSQPEDEKDISTNYQKKLIKYINRDEEIILFERELIPEYHQNIYIYPITTEPKDDNKINFLSYPVVFSVKHNLTLENFEKIINERFSHILNNTSKSQHIIDLHILHWKRNLNTGIMKIIKEYPKCRFCGNDYSIKKYCPLYLHFNKNDTIANIFKEWKISEPFVLLARSSYYDLNKEVYPGYYFEENNNLNKYKNIYDSLNQFNKFEFLGDDNLWNCPKCLDKRRINKAIKIFRAPKYLIIQLKRFKKKSNGFFNFLEGDKNETFVSFPIKNLDLSNYIEGPGKINSIYNLYAVINHKSISGCNHFTAFCKDSNNKWNEYDDHKIIYNINNPVTNDAYILFYSKIN